MSRQQFYWHRMCNSFREYYTSFIIFIISRYQSFYFPMLLSHLFQSQSLSITLCPHNLGNLVVAPQDLLLCQYNRYCLLLRINIVLCGLNCGGVILVTDTCASLFTIDLYVICDSVCLCSYYERIFQPRIWVKVKVPDIVQVPASSQQPSANGIFHSPVARQCFNRNASLEYGLS